MLTMLMDKASNLDGEIAAESAPTSSHSDGAAVQPTHWIEVQMADVRTLAEGVIHIVFTSGDGGPLPGWAPGAHLDIRLPSGLIRQYSLCGDPRDTSRYEVAVLDDPAGRGGSHELHAIARTGLTLAVRSPRNHFELEEAASYLFVAGGIGITPILPMIEHVERAGSSWQLIYGGRTRAGIAFLDRLSEQDASRLRIHIDDENGRPDLPAIFAGLDSSTLVYCCGPTGLLDLIEAQADELGIRAQVRMERFAGGSNAPAAHVAEDVSFEVELAARGTTVVVPADKSILDVIIDLDPTIPYACSEGYCGTCEVRVLKGKVDHRDTMFEPEENDEAGRMYICVSRAKDGGLVLDL